MLFGLKPEGDAPIWHQIGDTFDKIDPAVLANSYDLIWKLIQKIDNLAADNN